MGPPAPSPYPNCPDCMHAQYVVGPKTNTATDHGVTVPQSNAQAMMLGCDINNDGEIDNQLGKVLGALKAASMNVDVQASVDKSVAPGGSSVVADTEYKRSTTHPLMSGVTGCIGMHDASDGKTCDGANPCACCQGGGHVRVQTAVDPGLGGQVNGGDGEYVP